MKTTRNLALALIGACALLAGCANDEATSCSNDSAACSADKASCCSKDKAASSDCCKKDAATAAPAKQ